MAALLAGESAHKVARRFELSRTTVRRWRDQAWAAAQNGPQKRKIDAQMLGYVGESLDTQQAQLQTMCDYDWLDRQSAADLARLHGVLFDQTARLLRAFEFAPEDCAPGGASERR